MKKIKVNLLAIIGMMVAVATVAFTAPKESSLDDYVWYEVNSDGTIKQTPDSALPDLCPEDNDTDYCAIMLEESVTPPLTIQQTDLEGGPVTTKDHRFREKQ